MFYYDDDEQPGVIEDTFTFVKYLPIAIIIWAYIKFYDWVAGDKQ